MHTIGLAVPIFMLIAIVTIVLLVLSILALVIDLYTLFPSLYESALKELAHDVLLHFQQTLTL